MTYADQARYQTCPKWAAEMRGNATKTWAEIVDDALLNALKSDPAPRYRPRSIDPRSPLSNRAARLLGASHLLRAA